MYIDLETCIEANGGRGFRGVIHVGAHQCEEADDYATNGIQRVLWVDANPFLCPDPLTMNTPAMRPEYINVALGDVDGERVCLHVASNSASSSVLPLGTHKSHYPEIRYVGRIPMKARRFDRLYGQGLIAIDLGQYDFINVDVQGAELSVLRGFGDLLARNHFRAVYCEINFEPMYVGCALVDEVDDYLSRFRFHRAITAAPEGCFGDALYLRRDWHPVWQ